MEDKNVIRLIKVRLSYTVQSKVTARKGQVSTRTSTNVGLPVSTTAVINETTGELKDPEYIIKKACFLLNLDYNKFKHIIKIHDFVIDENIKLGESFAKYED
jgi:hypothetical protein